MMKSRQKSDRRRLRFSEGLQQAAWKLPDSTTNSTAPSQEITKSEPVGQTRTRDCIDCGTGLVLGENWTEARERQGKYVCKPCWQVRDSQRMYVNGKHISKSHPLYKAGKYKGFEDAAFSGLENYKTNPEGQVYIITNPAWEGWVKVGMAVDAEDRANGYQTSSPYRDYELAYVVDTKDRRATEADTHARLGDLFEQRNEWFKCDVEKAKRIIDGVTGEYDEAC